MPHTARRRVHHTLPALLFTVSLLGLEALSIEAVAGWLVLSVLGSVGVVVAAFHRLFPGSRFFTIALANFIGIYACIFIFFVEANFAAVSAPVLSIGFMLPLAAFLAGALRVRADIRAVVLEDGRRLDNKFGRAFVWLLPVGLIGLATFLVPQHWTAKGISDWFLASMAGISLIVLFASKDVAVLLLDTGLLFEEFFEQVARLVEPAFAFFTFYSLLVIVFASLYTVVDRFSAASHFVVHGKPQDITFGEALYFSVITLSTVGYGDIMPITDVIRVLVAGEVVAGVLLLLFGFNAIFSFSSERQRHRAEHHAHPHAPVAHDRPPHPRQRPGH